MADVKAIEISGETYGIADETARNDSQTATQTANEAREEVTSVGSDVEGLQTALENANEKITALEEQIANMKTIDPSKIIHNCYMSNSVTLSRSSPRGVLSLTIGQAGYNLLEIENISVVQGSGYAAPGSAGCVLSGLYKQSNGSYIAQVGVTIENDTDLSSSAEFTIVATVALYPVS